MPRLGAEREKEGVERRSAAEASCTFHAGTTQYPEMSHAALPCSVDLVLVSNDSSQPKDSRSNDCVPGPTSEGVRSNVGETTTIEERFLVSGPGGKLALRSRPPDRGLESCAAFALHHVPLPAAGSRNVRVRSTYHEGFWGRRRTCHSGGGIAPAAPRL
jgi:hypothetical protein